MNFSLEENNDNLIAHSNMGTYKKPQYNVVALLPNYRDVQIDGFCCEGPHCFLLDCHHDQESRKHLWVPF